MLIQVSRQNIVEDTEMTIQEREISDDVVRKNLETTSYLHTFELAIQSLRMYWYVYTGGDVALVDFGVECPLAVVSAVAHCLAHKSRSTRTHLLSSVNRED